MCLDAHQAFSNKFVNLQVATTPLRVAFQGLSMSLSQSSLIFSWAAKSLTCALPLCSNLVQFQSFLHSQQTEIHQSKAKTAPSIERINMLKIKKFEGFIWLHNIFSSELCENLSGTLISGLFAIIIFGLNPLARTNNNKCLPVNKLYVATPKLRIAHSIYH